MPSLFGLLVIAIGLVMIHYGVTGGAFPLTPIAGSYPPALGTSGPK